MGLPHERDHVVLAHAVQGDVPDHDHLVVAGPRDDGHHLQGIGADAGEELFVHRRHKLWRPGDARP